MHEETLNKERETSWLQSFKKYLTNTLTQQETSSDTTKNTNFKELVRKVTKQQQQAWGGKDN